MEKSEAEMTEELRKDLANGCYSRCTKADFHELIQALAEDIRSPNETPAQAYTRAIEMTEPGKVLHKALKAAPDTAPGHRVEKHLFLAEIQARADQKFSEIPSAARRFAFAIDTDPHGRPYDKISRVLYETSKRAPGRDVPPAAPEPSVDIASAIAKRAGSASVQMLELARQHNAANPHLSEAQSYDRVYTSPKNVKLKGRVVTERMRELGLSGSDIDT